MAYMAIANQPIIFHKTLNVKRKTQDAVYTLYINIYINIYNRLAGWKEGSK